MDLFLRCNFFSIFRTFQLFYKFQLLILNEMELVSRVLERRESPFAVLASLSPGSPLDSSSSNDVLRGAYLGLVKALHPDKNKNIAEATEAFQVLVRAYDSVMSEVRRKQTLRKGKPSTGNKGAAKLTATETEETAQNESRQRSSSGAKRRRPIKEEEISSEEEKGEFSEGMGDSEEPPIAVLTRDELEKRNRHCYRTPIRCPRCGPKSRPCCFDNKDLYTLFMSRGHKVHCEGCLLEFGSYSALHYCPLCDKVVSYDPSFYEKRVRCPGCRQVFGYLYTNVSRDAYDQMCRRKRQEEAAEEHRSRREERARKRKSKSTSKKDEQLTLLIGQCVIDEKCPLCLKVVKSSHRSHVLSCYDNREGKPKQRKIRKFIA